MRFPPTRPVVLAAFVLCATVSFAGAKTIIYSNSLTDSNALINFDYIDNTFGTTNTPNGGFVVNSSGLSWTNNTNGGSYGTYIYTDQSLPASNSWVATVRVHLTNFAFVSTNSPPWIYGGLVLVQFDGSTNITNSVVYAQNKGIVNAKFVRTDWDTNNDGTPDLLVNLFDAKLSASSFGIDAENLIAPVPERFIANQVTDLWLRLSYEAPVTRLTYSYSTNGTDYSDGVSLNLSERWGITETNEFLIGVTAENSKYEAEQVIYPITTGQLYLRDFSIESTPLTSVVWLEGSSNLSNWTNIPLVPSNMNSKGEIIIGEPANTNNQFYRMGIDVLP